MKYAILCLLIATSITCGAFASPPQERPSVRADHPRLGFRPEGTAGARTFAFVRDLYQHDDAFRSYVLPAIALAEKELSQPTDPLLQASCWVATGEERFAEAALAALREAELKPTAERDYYSEVWGFALAYDWLFMYPKMTDDLRRAIEARIADVLERELRDLDGGYSVVWHGRTQLANNCLIAALALDRDPRAKEFQRRTLTHYADAMRALQLSEGWPEGTSYWIHNRAFPFALASDCYLTAVGQERVEGLDIRGIIARTALWQLYSLQPDFSFARGGDCWEDGLIAGPGLWQPVVDYYARITGDPAVNAAAQFFRLNSRHQYHAGRYGWSAVLAYDPRLPMPADYRAARPEDYLNAHLPRTALFGRHTLGQAFLTRGWGKPDEDWVAFRAGAVMAHHGHYDQGSFLIHAGSPLAVKSGVYADYFGDYRLGYFTQTVSSNSLLIHAPGEFGSFSRAAGNFDAVTGGQRPVMPSGSHIVSVADWMNNLHAGRHYAAGEITAFEAREWMDYIAADLTRAYNSTSYAEPGNPAKVSLVTRQLLYLRLARAVVIRDHVVTTDPSSRVQWLLHTPAKPESASERVVEGTAEDGILATDDRWLEMSYEKGKLFHQVLSGGAEVLKIGGPHYRHYVEVNGEGRNLEPAGERHEEPQKYGTWRVQVNAPTDRTDHVLLNVLFLRLANEESASPAEVVSQEESRTVVSIAGSVAVFATLPRGVQSLSYAVPAETEHHTVVGLPGRSTWEIKTPGATQTLIASAEGVLTFDTAEGEGEVAMRRIAEQGKGGFQ